MRGDVSLGMAGINSIGPRSVVGLTRRLPVGGGGRRQCGGDEGEQQRRMGVGEGGRGGGMRMNMLPCRPGAAELHLIHAAQPLPLLRCCGPAEELTSGSIALRLPKKKKKTHTGTNPVFVRIPIYSPMQREEVC